MSTNASLTTAVQTFIRSELALKIIQANTAHDIGDTAQQIRENLTDTTTLITPEFMIRRYLQTFHPGLLADLGPLTDLTAAGKNIPWPAAAITALSKKLEKLSREQGAAISAKEWSRYLDKSVPTDREKFFRLAFSLKMDTQQTLDLLLAYGMEPYSVRYPLDMICLFCQKIGGTYTWAQAEQMLSDFMARRTRQEAGAAAATEGGSTMMQTDLNALFEANLQGSNAQKALVDYMVAHSGEFVSFQNKGKETFLPGYSRQRSQQFARLSQYLAVLYPYVIVPDKRKNEGGDPTKMDLTHWSNTYEYVINQETGKLSIPTLVRAMFSDCGWNDLYWNEESKKGTFDYNMRVFCNNYEQHIAKVNRLFTGGNNIAFFDRRDALLFIFFLIRGVSRLLSFNDDTSRYWLAQLKKMAGSGTTFDTAIGQLLNRVEAIRTEGPDAAEEFRSLCACFDLILTQMGHHKLYLPAQFDRFVLLALLSKNPDELTPLIMSEAEWEDYDMPFLQRPADMLKR